MRSFKYKPGRPRVVLPKQPKGFSSSKGHLCQAFVGNAPALGLESKFTPHKPQIFIHARIGEFGIIYVEIKLLDLPLL